MFVLAAGGGEETAGILVMFSLFVAAYAAGIVFVIVDFRRHLREASTAGLACKRCGYDLRAACHACCPECGGPSGSANAKRQVSGGRLVIQSTRAVQEM
jgi:hypothetical protein